MTAEYNITADQGAHLRLVMRFRTDTGAVDLAGEPVYAPLNLTGATIHAQVRETTSSPVLAEPSTVVTGDGEITLTLTPTQTAAITRARYDVLAILAGGDRKRLIQGTIVARPRITEEPTP